MGLITGKLVPTLLPPKLLFVALELRHVEVSLSDPRHGRFYLLEQPANASSWQEDSMKNFLLQSEQAHVITGHMCQYGMMTPGSDSEPGLGREAIGWKAVMGEASHLQPMHHTAR